MPKVTAPGNLKYEVTSIAQTSLRTQDQWPAINGRPGFPFHPVGWISEVAGYLVHERRDEKIDTQCSRIRNEWLRYEQWVIVTGG